MHPSQQPGLATSHPILITGASGNVGAPLVNLLAAAGLPVRAAFPPTAMRNCSPLPGVTPVALDFTDPASFGPALTGVRRLFLMRPPALADTRRFINPFIDAAQAAGVERIVFLSLLGAERNPIVPHRQVEDYLQSSGLPWIFLRPSFFMQNLSGPHRADIKERGEILVPAGGGATSFIDARDIAAVAALTLTEDGHTGHAYPLTGAEALDYHAVSAIFSAELGRPVVYRRPSIPRFIARMRRQGFDWPFILVMVAIYTTARVGLAGGVTPDTARLLGRAPISMSQFVHDHRACWA